MKVIGGKSTCDTAVGILMLETRFPRILGDTGNALSWPFPVLYRVVPGASPARVVRESANNLLDSFIQAGKQLIADGVDGIVINCGFLSLFQAELSRALEVPIASSSLLQVPLVESLLPPNQRCGILTISAADLTHEHLLKAGCRADTPIGGTPANGKFNQTILNNQLILDTESARRENVEAAKKLTCENPKLGAIVLECTNMVPYAADIRAAVGLPVFSMYSFVTWFQQGLLPRRF